MAVGPVEVKILKKNKLGSNCRSSVGVVEQAGDQSEAHVRYIVPELSNLLEYGLILASLEI